MPETSKSSDPTEAESSAMNVATLPEAIGAGKEDKNAPGLNNENEKISAQESSSPPSTSDPASSATKVPKCNIVYVPWPAKSNDAIEASEAVVDAMEPVEVEDPIPLEKPTDYEDIVAAGGDAPIPENLKDVTYEHLRRFYLLSIEDATLKFKEKGCVGGVTQFKQTCRSCNIARWPFRQIKSLTVGQKQLQEVGSIVKIEQHNKWVRLYNDIMSRMTKAMYHIYDHCHEEHMGLEKKDKGDENVDNTIATIAATGTDSITPTTTTDSAKESEKDGTKDGEVKSNPHPIVDYVGKLTNDAKQLVQRLAKALGDGNEKATAVSKKTFSEMWETITPTAKVKKSEKESMSHDLLATIKHIKAAAFKPKGSQKSKVLHSSRDTESQPQHSAIRKGWFPSDLKQLHPVTAESIDPLAATKVSIGTMKEWWSDNQEPHIPENFGKSNKRLKRDKDMYEAQQVAQANAELFHFYEGPVVLPPLNMTEPIEYDKQGPLILVEPHLPTVRNLEVVMPRFGIERLLEES